MVENPLYKEVKLFLHRRYGTNFSATTCHFYMGLFEISEIVYGPGLLFLKRQTPQCRDGGATPSVAHSPCRIGLRVEGKRRQYLWPVHYSDGACPSCEAEDARDRGSRVPRHDGPATGRPAHPGTATASWRRCRAPTTTGLSWTSHRPATSMPQAPTRKNRV